LCFKKGTPETMKISLHLILTVLITNCIMAQIPKVTTGTIRQYENFKSKYVAARNIDVWLPEGYDVKKKYRVLYMQDGRSLFDSTITWNKQSLGVDEALGKLIKEGQIGECIVVGIWNGGPLRHSEYFPQRPFESLATERQSSIYKMSHNKLGSKEEEPLFADKVQSDNYLKFIVRELKPFIDSAFSTLSDQPNTFVMGSSMGGLISLYAICEYPDVFGGAACLSTHWVGIPDSKDNPVPAVFMSYLKEHLPDARNHKIYFDHGTATLDSLYGPYQKQVDAIMMAKGYDSGNWMTRVFPGGSHSENAWRRRLSIPLTFLLK